MLRRAIFALALTLPTVAWAGGPINPPPPTPVADCPGGQTITGYPYPGAPLGTGGHCGSGVSTGTINTSTVGQLGEYSGTGTMSGITPGGDLSFLSPNFTVTKINGATLGSTTATSGNLLFGSGSQWVTHALSGDATVTSAGVLTIGAGAVTAAKMGAGAAVTNIGAGNVTNTLLQNPGLTLGSTPLTLGATTTSVSGLTLVSPTISGPTLSGTVAGAYSNSGNVTFGAGAIFTNFPSAPLFGTDSGGNLRAITLGNGLSLSGATLNASGGTGGGFIPPASGTLMISNATIAPNGLAEVDNAFLVGAGGAWTTLASVASSVPCWSAGSVLSACSTATMQSLLGYLTGNQSISLSGDASGSGTTSITATNLKVNGVAYPSSPPTNTVPAITSSNQVTYETGANLAALSGFGTMLTQNASAVAITGGSIIGTTINGPSNTITNIANASLANSSMTLAGHSVSLGGTQAFAIGDLSNINNSTIVGNNSGGAGPPLALTAAQISTMLGLGTLASQNANALNVTGVTSLTGLPACSAASDACPKSYIDAAVVGAVLHTQVAAASAAALPNTPVVASGTGVGKTLTSAANAALVVDGYTVLLNDRVLVKDQATGSDNGIYSQTTLGTGSVKWVLTRTTDFDQATAGEVALGAYVFVANGTVNSGTQWQLGAPTPASITVDTTALTFNKLNTSQSLSADGTTILNTGGVLSALPNGILSAVTATPNSLLARGASTWAGIAPVNSAVLVTSGAGVPSESTTLPSGLTIPGYLTANQSITLSGAVTGSGTTAITTTLASVADSTLLANVSGGSAAPSAQTLTAVIDHDIGATANSLLIRGASTWGLMSVVNNAVVVTSGAGVPSEATTLPSGLTIPSHTVTGTVTATGATITGPTMTSTTLTTPTINGAALSGTFSGNFTISGVPIYSGLSAGTQVSCVGLDSGNHLVLNAAACGTGSSTVATGIAAAGTTLAGATAITANKNFVATGANCTTYPSCVGTAGVKVDPTLMVAGTDIYVRNEDQANAMLIYPDTTGHTINTQAAGVAYAVQANQTAHLMAKSSAALATLP